jgi:hypothetical protein
MVLRACNTRFLTIIFVSAEIFDPFKHFRVCSANDEIRSAYTQPAMKFVQDDEIPEMKMRKQLFQLVKFLRGASRNLWSFLQGRDNRRDEQGKSEGPHREYTVGAIGHGGTSCSFSCYYRTWAVSGLFRPPPLLLYIRAIGVSTHM